MEEAELSFVVAMKCRSSMWVVVIAFVGGVVTICLVSGGEYCVAASIMLGRIGDV